jgi:hypothetical protein
LTRATGFTGQTDGREGILPDMSTRTTLRLAGIATLLTLATGCAKMARNDRYTPPPNDGSVPANSEDVTDNPPIVPN